LLGAGITLRRGKDGETNVDIIYRFGPPDVVLDAEGVVVGNVQDSLEFCMTGTNALTLTVVAVK
jgi:hypothetical protein